VPVVIGHINMSVGEVQNFRHGDQG